MTAAEKIEYQKKIESAIESFGFAFSRIGCPCSGSQRIYNVTKGKTRFELHVWVSRGYWHLYNNKLKVSYGTNNEYLQQQIQQLWDSFS